MLPFFRLPSSCQPVLLLLVLKGLFPFSNQLLLWRSAVLLSLATIARDSPLNLSHGPASYCSSLHTEGVLGKLTLTLSSCWQPVLPPVSLCSAVPCLSPTFRASCSYSSQLPPTCETKPWGGELWSRIMFTRWKKSVLMLKKNYVSETGLEVGTYWDFRHVTTLGLFFFLIFIFWKIDF